MTEQPIDDSSYPSEWRPAWVPKPEPAPDKPEAEPLAMELHVAAMTDDEFEAFVKRARGGH
jgi:hypothetical protein